LLQTVTFRLADSLPREKLDRLEEELKILPESLRGAERRKRIEEWLDSGLGCCALRDPELATQMRNALRHFDGKRYRLLAWCIMPNHVHVLMETLSPIAWIVQGWKSVTARWALARNEEL
jgi:REP element-mobilizing transposase RayT